MQVSRNIANGPKGNN